MQTVLHSLIQSYRDNIKQQSTQSAIYKTQLRFSPRGERCPAFDDAFVPGTCCTSASVTCSWSRWRVWTERCVYLRPREQARRGSDRILASPLFSSTNMDARWYTDALSSLSNPFTRIPSRRAGYIQGKKALPLHAFATAKNAHSVDPIGGQFMGVRWVRHGLYAKDQRHRTELINGGGRRARVFVVNDRGRSYLFFFSLILSSYEGVSSFQGYALDESGNW